MCDASEIPASEDDTFTADDLSEEELIDVSYGVCIFYVLLFNNYAVCDACIIECG